MMILISIPFATNSPNACPRSAEANSVEHTTTQSFSPETQQALDRWYPEQDDWYGLFPQANQHKLSDFLAHPIKNISVLLGMGVTVFPVFGLALSSFGLIAMTSNPNAMSHPEAKGVVKTFTRAALKHSALTLFCGGLTFLDYLYQKNRNKDTLKGIQILGEKATRDDWINYKKSHPKIKQA
jgi:hypothetical protein